VHVPDEVINSDLIEALGECRFLICEPLLELGAQLRHLLKNELDVEIHGTELSSGGVYNRRLPLGSTTSFAVGFVVLTKMLRTD
jgi:hypothetical protein